MRACSGLEAARELLGAIGEGMSLPNREADVFFGILPYAGAPLLAGTEAARPRMLPMQSENLAVLGPFVSGSFSPVRTLLDARRAVEALSRPLPAAAGRDFFRRSPSGVCGRIRILPDEGKRGRGRERICQTFHAGTTTKERGK